MERPYTILSCAISVDGRIDDASPERLRLSNEEDFAEIDELRAGCDAILVGAGTLRADDPRLLIRSEKLRERRRDQGRTEHLLKAVITRKGHIDPKARLFNTGDAGAVVYTGGSGVEIARKGLEGRPTNDPPAEVAEDRKSTRLNSSHVSISYAVFCLKKKIFSHCILLKFI